MPATGHKHRPAGPRVAPLQQPGDLTVPIEAETLRDFLEAAADQVGCRQADRRGKIIGNHVETAVRVGLPDEAHGCCRAVDVDARRSAVGRLGNGVATGCRHHLGPSRFFGLHDCIVVRLVGHGRDRGFSWLTWRGFALRVRALGEVPVIVTRRHRRPGSSRVQCGSLRCVRAGGNRFNGIFDFQIGRHGRLACRLCRLRCDFGRGDRDLFSGCSFGLLVRRSVVLVAGMLVLIMLGQHLVDHRQQMRCGVIDKA